MSKEEKKKLRKYFRDTCFARDNYTCKLCGKKSTPEKVVQEMNCHHITDGSKMPNGGTVPSNGITLCETPCHLKAEQFHATGTAAPDCAPDDLYKLINSSYEIAVKASEKLKSNT